MIVISYWDRQHEGGEMLRVGLLFWREPEGQPIQAMGGFDVTHGRLASADAATVVSTDAGDRTLPGWVHPDKISELHGQ